MKNLPIPALIIVLVACSTDQKPVVEPTELRVGSTYKEPSFDDPERLSKFKSTTASMDSIFLEHAEDNHYPGLVYGLLVDGELIHSGSSGVIHLDSRIPVGNNSAFHIASMTKSFTSMGIMVLRDEGRLNLDDPAHKYIPEMKALDYPTLDSTPITIKNLMTMSSGFPEDNPWADRQLEETDEAFLEMIRTGLPFSNLPSTTYEYSNTGYAMLGTIINNVTGGTYQDFITEKILKPLGMNNTYWEYEAVPEDQLAVGYRWEEAQWKEEPLLHSGAFGAIGGLITTLNDFSKYVAFVMSAWPPSNEDDRGPVKRSSLREMQQPIFSRLVPNSLDSKGDACPQIRGYGYGLAVRTDCNQIMRVSHSGGLPGFGSEYSMFPDFGFAVISFSNRTYAGTGSVNSRVANIIFDSGIKPRKLGASDILEQRFGEVSNFLLNWEDTSIFAENFFLDKSLELRKKGFDELMESSGPIQSVDSLEPLNQLRGTFYLRGENKDIRVQFTLSPETEPKVQALYFRVNEK